MSPAPKADESGITPIAETTCPTCHAPCNRVGDLDRDIEAPRLGDPVLCLRCTAVNTLTSAGTLRALTAAEFAALEPEHIAAIAALQTKLRAFARWRASAEQRGES